MLMQVMCRTLPKICPWHSPRSHGLQRTNPVLKNWLFSSQLSKLCMQNCLYFPYYLLDACRVFSDSPSFILILIIHVFSPFSLSFLLDLSIALILSKSQHCISLFSIIFLFSISLSSSILIIFFLMLVLGLLCSSLQSLSGSFGY